MNKSLFDDLLKLLNSRGWEDILRDAGKNRLILGVLLIILGVMGALNPLL
ncbi:MAG: hypothetical protein L6N94_06800 [Candidatus Methylarchaceae archaeon HK01M]|nr:hypothetical protein [Candidatus Methylarchaceae archaeon HK01M]